MKNLFYIITSFIDKNNEKKVLEKIKSILRDQVNFFIDVGFYKGDFYKNLSKKIKVKKAVGFEPNPKIYNQGLKNFKNENIRLFNHALGDENCKKSFNINSEESSSSFNDLNKNSKYLVRKNRILNLFGLNEKKIIDVEIFRLDEVLNKNDINEKIDLIKIDTEGFELKVLKGLGLYLKKVNLLHFEHHYDDMLLKDYTFGDINDFLKENNFEQVLKIKMKFRKSFEYLYKKKD